MPRNNPKKMADITEDAGDTQSLDGAASSQGDIRELLGGIRSEAALKMEILAELKSSISAMKTSLLEQQKLKDVEESLTDVDGRVTALESIPCRKITNN